jgi:hypothetical protein
VNSKFNNKAYKSFLDIYNNSLLYITLLILSIFIFKMLNINSLIACNQISIENIFSEDLYKFIENRRCVFYSF